MNLSRIRRTAAALLAASVITLPAAAAGIEINGSPLPQRDGWVEDGVSYVTLAALSQTADYSLTWDGSAALLAGRGTELAAQPGSCYIEVNGRALYLPQGVKLREGRTALPLRLLEEALGGQVTWDGVTSTACLDLTQAWGRRADYDQEDLYWLSRIISAESRGEPLLGQIAVGNVVLNRVKSDLCPNTVKEVIFEVSNGAVQFEPVSNGSIYREPAASSVLAAKLCLEGASVVGESLYFYAPSLSAGSWISSTRTYYTTIGSHRFYL